MPVTPKSFLPTAALTGRGLRRRAAAFDRLPVSPASVGEALVGVAHDRRQAVAATDPEWAAIEARRHVEGRGAVIFLSDDLSFDDWERQLEISRSLSKDPVWLPAARALTRMRAYRATLLVTSAAQRMRRGWADEDTWNLGWRLCEVLAGQMRHLAEHGNGWPASSEFPKAEDWERALVAQADALDAYRADTDDLEALAAAQTSLRWVADHLPALWD